jgi:hypothetical protein
VKRTTTIVLSALFASSIGGTAMAGTKVTEKDLPEPVRQAFDKEAKGATIIEVEKEMEDGKVFYEIDYRQGPMRGELEIAPDGTLLSKEVKKTDATEKKSTEPTEKKPIEPVENEPMKE